MSQELQQITEQKRELSPYGEAILRKIEKTYGSDYPAKPAPRSIELLADNRDKIPTLYQIQQVKGQTFINALIAKCMSVIVSRYVHVIRGMDSTMIGATAELISQRYPLMNPADVKFFLTKGVLSEYGPILDRVDGTLILSWAGQYWEQMKNLIRLRQKNAEKDDPKVPVPAVIADLSEKLRVKESQKQVNKVTTEKHESVNEWYEKRGIDIEQRNAECASLGTIKTD